MNTKLSPKEVMDNLARYGVTFFGYNAKKKSSKVSGEDLVIGVLQNYLTEEPRYVEALVAVITNPSLDFKKLHDKAVEADIGHRVHWLLMDYIPALEAAGLQERAGILKSALPLFSRYTRSLEDELSLQPDYRKLKVNRMASKAARYCGVPVVYDFRSLKKTARLYCG